MARGPSRDLLPPCVGRVHDRERLFRLLDGERARRVVWIEAPPGAGKTVLLASWLRARRLRALWYTHGGGDDVASLFTRLAAAGRGHRGGQGLPEFRPEHLATLDAYARRFFEALTAPGRAPQVVVFDDYQAVGTDSLLHRALAQGIAAMAPGTTVLVASRGPPPPALARLVAAGEVGLVPAAALALEPREARAVARLRGRQVPPEELLALAQGWAAGVVLLAVAGAQGTADVAAPCTVFEYLAAEVFGAAAPATRDVLLRTCLLHEVDAADAARLSGDPEAGEILLGLARAGWFVERVGTSPARYRLHALFRAFLVARARAALGPAAFHELVRATAACQLDAGEVDGAAALLAAERAWDELVRLLVERGPALAAAGRLEAMVGWLDALPPSHAAATPWLAYWRGISTFPRDPAAALASVEAAFHAFAGAGDPVGAWRSWAAAVDLRVHALDDVAPLARWLAVLPELRARLPFPDPATEAAVVGAALSGFTNRLPRDPAVGEWEERALELALSPGDARLRMDVGRQLALRLAFWGTDVVRARIVLEALRPIATAPDAEPLHAIMWHFGEANYHAHVGAAAAALEASDRGLAIAARSGVHALDALLRAVRIFGALAAEDFASAVGDLEVMAPAGTFGGRLAVCAYQYAAAAVALRRGELRDAVERARAAARLGEEAGSPYAASAATVIWAAAAARGGGAGPTLEEATVAVREAGYEVGLFGVLLLRAGAALSRGDEGGAEVHLREALALARRLGVANSVCVARAELAELCAFALERDVFPDLAVAIVRARGLAAGPRGRYLGRWPWAARVEVLGAFTWSADGADAGGKKTPRKPLELLRLLVAHGEHGAPLDRLGEALWPDADGDTAHRALETTMFRLRRLLGDHAAVVRRDGRAFLDPGRVFVDAWAFESLARRALGDGAQAVAAEPARLRAAALELYRGDLLPDDDHLPGIVSARERLRARALRLGAALEA